MSTEQNESSETGQESAPITAYQDAVESYLEAAKWLTDLDAPLKVHLRQVARSLDAQLTKSGEIQSALASSFDKCMSRLDARRPAPAPDPMSGQLPGQTAIEVGGFGVL
mgnify:CR=1 FL=1